jgi:hypothetical protein
VVAATALGAPSILNEAEHNRIQWEEWKTELDSEDSKVLWSYIDHDESILGSRAAEIYEASGRRMVSNLTETLGGKIELGFAAAKPAMGRKALAMGLLKEVDNVTPKKASKFLEVMEGMIVGSQKTLIGRTASKAGISGFGGEYLEEMVDAAAQTLIDMALVEDPEEAKEIAAKITDFSRLFDPSDGSTPEERASLVATLITIPGGQGGLDAVVSGFKKVDASRAAKFEKLGRKVAPGLAGKEADREAQLEKTQATLDDIYVKPVEKKAERRKQRAEKARKEVEALEKASGASDQAARALQPAIKSARRKAKRAAKLDAATQFELRGARGESRARFQRLSERFTTKQQRLYQAVGELEQFYKRRPWGRKQYQSTLKALATGLQKVKTQEEAEATVDDIYRTLRMGGDSPSAQRTWARSMGDHVGNVFRRMFRAKGGIINFSKVLEQVMPEYVSRMHYGEITRDIRKAENRAREKAAKVADRRGLEGDRRTGYIEILTEEAGKKVVADALSQGFFSIAEVDDVSQKEIMQSIVDDIVTMTDKKTGKTYNTLPFSVWDELSSDKQEVLARYLQIGLDASTTDEALEKLESVSIVEVDNSQNAAVNAVRISEALGVSEHHPVVKGALQALQSATDNGEYRRVVVVPDSIRAQATEDLEEAGHFGAKGAKHGIFKAVNVSDTLYIQPSTTSADITEEQVELEMKDNGFLDNDTASAAAIRTLFAQFEVLADLMVKRSKKKGKKTITYTRNMGTDNPQTIEVSVNEVLKAIRQMQRLPNKPMAALEFFSSIYTQFVGADSISTADLNEYSQATDVTAHTLLFDMLTQLPETQGAFDTYFDNVTQLYLPAETWSRVTEDTANTPLDYVINPPRTLSPSAQTWADAVTAKAVAGVDDIEADPNAVAEAEAILSAMSGENWSLFETEEEVKDDAVPEVPEAPPSAGEEQEAAPAEEALRWQVKRSPPRKAQRSTSNSSLRYPNSWRSST